MISAPRQPRARHWCDIAVIGMAGRFPGARDIDEFWRNLLSGKDSITHFTDEELLKAGIPEHVLRHSHYVKAAPLLTDYNRFDAAFFHFTPAEAVLIDPQHRIFLECAWEALETAGYSTGAEHLRAAVFAGAALNTYLAFGGLFDELRDNFIPTLIGNDKDFLATRVSYKLNLTGPSATIQTACSTSLVAVHFACGSLINGEADIAIAGGVAIKVPQLAGYLCKAGSIVSPDGRCRPFDANANGTVFGSGVGVIVLRRLEDAVADRDNILAVIRGTAINNDGADKASFAAPRSASQTAIMREALSMSGVPAESLSLVEAHGTGTRLGDPIEVAALAAAFAGCSKQGQFCWLGSVKANVGHLDAAAGITGMIKCILALRNGKIPPNPLFKAPNPEINFGRSPFKINDRVEEWPRGDAPRRAGVNALGVGGTNAFVVVEESPQQPEKIVTSPFHIVTLSAKTASALESYRCKLSAFLRAADPGCMSDVCFTQHVGRHAFSYRAALVAAANEDARAIARRIDNGELQTNHCESCGRPVVFAFSDVAIERCEQWPSLCSSEPAIRDAFEECLSCFSSEPGVADWLRAASTGTPDALADGLHQPYRTLAQFITAYVLARFWTSLGVTPAAVVGSGIGALVAACHAGILPLRRALQIALLWGRSPSASPTTEAALDLLMDTTFGIPSLPVMSCVKADWIGNSSAVDPLFWHAELHGEPQWERTIGRLESELIPVRLEVVTGKCHPALSRNASKDCAHTIPGPSDVHQTLASLWLSGVALDWKRFHSSEHCGRIAIPTYPFERQIYWPKHEASGRGVEPVRAPEHIDQPQPHLSRNQMTRWDRAHPGIANGVAGPSESRRPPDILAGRYPTALHGSLARMWSETLGVAEIGMHDDFFKLGGDSLMLVDVLERVNVTFGIDLPMTDLFLAPTIAELAEVINRVFDDAANFAR